MSYVISQDTYLGFCRNRLVDKAKEICTRDFKRLPDYYMFIDDDTIVYDGLFEDLAKVNRDVVSANYCRKKRYDPVWRPIDPKDDDKAFNDGELVECRIMGAGALLVKGEVFEKVKYPWFVIQDAGTDLMIGEDKMFITKCREAGIKPVVATGIKVGHLGGACYPQDYDNMKNNKRPWAEYL